MKEVKDRNFDSDNRKTDDHRHEKQLSDTSGKSSMLLYGGIGLAIVLVGVVYFLMSGKVGKIRDENNELKDMIRGLETSVSQQRNVLSQLLQPQTKSVRVEQAVPAVSPVQVRKNVKVENVNETIDEKIDKLLKEND